MLWDDDIRIAEQALEQARRKELVGRLYESHGGYFGGVARRLLYHPQKWKDVLQDFFEELLTVQPWDSYLRKRGEGSNLSLKAWLTMILKRRVVDENRKSHPKDGKRVAGNQWSLSDQEDPQFETRDKKEEHSALDKLYGSVPTVEYQHCSRGEGLEGEDFSQDEKLEPTKVEARPGRIREPAEEKTPEFVTMGNEREKLIQSLISEALIELASISPKDAELVKMFLEGKNYKDMARSFLKKEGGVMSEQALKTKEAAIRKRFTRKDPAGTLWKFSKIFSRVMERKGLTEDDLESNGGQQTG